MQRTKLTYRSFKVRSGKKHHGFTLVELIVVLAILAILSAIGVVTIFGHIKKSNFEQNSQNAVSVYQAAQNALSQKVANGTQDSWTRKLVELKCSSDQIVAFEKDLDKNNESNTMKLSLTFNPNSPTGSEDSYLYNLLTSEFYDKSIFGGTMAIELDVVATYSKGKIYYSSWVSSAFYCKQNDSGTGWDSDRIGESLDGLPQRYPYSYRSDTSLVGWFDGTADSVTGPDGVCPVYIPQTIINELDGHILADSTDSGYLVNLRNGETLDVSWAILDTDGVLRDDHQEDELEFTLISEETDYGNAQKYDDVKLKISQANLSMFRGNVASQSEKIIHECVNSKTNITRYERTALITVEVDDGYSSRSMQFPMTVSRVMGDDRVGCPDPTVGYYEYRLSLDCMIIRSDEANTPDARFNAERLFGLTPRNISATFSCAFNQYIEGGTNPQKVDNTKAARAIDDPVYFTGVATVKGNTSYCYTVRAGMAAYDGDDNPEAGTTGKCVVNTLFGDYKYNDIINGTSWTFDGGDAVITSFRHLYNIRWIQNGTVNYRIVRDLNWYTNKSGLLTVSDVKVFRCSDGECRTPAFITNDTDTSLLNIVSFPAIRELRAGQTLTSMSKANGTKYSINNLQMRAASFVNNTDEGYGLICKNSGTIYNIYTNNFNLVLSAVSDMSSSDYGNISESEVTIATKNGSSLNKAYYVGGLVGLNHGNIGNSDDSADDNENVIMMSNSIILACKDASDYWSAGNYEGVGGVIGKNANENSYSPTLSGTIEINGRFAVVGNNRVGGVIAYSNSDIGARIVVDGNSNNSVGASGFTLPKELSTGSNNNLSCVIAGTNTVGGAIGYLDNCSLTYTVPEISVSSYDQVTNKVYYADHDEDYYQIYVDLPEDSLIVDLDIDKANVDVGGAIGYMLNCSGDYMSVYVKNLGNILIRDKSANSNVVGGAIGRDNGSSIKDSFLTVFNGDGAIGSFLDDTNKPLNKVEYCGGVYGRIENVSASADRTIFMDVTNDGAQISAISDSGDNQGAGGAIGVLMESSVKLIANITNEPNTKIVYHYSNNYTKNIGSGGAIGAIQKKDNSYLASGSNVFVENNGYIYARYNAGGAIGVMNANHGGIYAYNNGSSIEGEYCVGGAVGWCKAANDGETRSILSDTTVSGVDFVGGAIGRNPNLQGGSITTKVYGDSKVSGRSVAGGVCGYVTVQGDGTGTLVLDGNAISTLTVVTTGDGVGGVVGLLCANIENKAHVEAGDVILNVKGSKFVGGAVGKLRSTSWENNSNANANADTNKALNENKTKNNINVYVDVVLPHPSRIEGTENVGGAIGFVHCLDNGIFGGYVGVKTKAGNSDESAIISGTFNVGGAIGHFGSCYPDWVDDNSRIVVDFTDSPITIESTISAEKDANLGGAVGFFDSDKDVGNKNCNYVITADLGYSSISAQGSNVGGAIGKNTIHTGCISVSSSGSITGNKYVAGGIGYCKDEATSVDVTLGNDGSAEIYGAGAYVGGAVGFSQNPIDEVSVDIKGDSSITGVGNYVGGAVGNNKETIGAVTVSIAESSSIIGYGNYVGGAIGYNAKKIGDISVDLDDSLVSGGYFDDNDVLIGGDFIGGAIGYDEGDLDAVSVTISGNSVVDGGVNIGGAVGQLTSSTGTALTASSISVSIASDNAISGYRNLGGAIGLIGSTNNVKSINVNGVSVELDGVGFPIKQGNNPYDDACIGAVIGHHYKGTIDSISLSGSGSSINTSSNSNNIGAPDRWYDNAVLITGKGKYIGGIIGKSGGSGVGSDSQTDSKVIGISAEGPSICVVSEDDSSYVGGWIGGCYSTWGVDADHKSEYSVSTIKVVYSKADHVGGVCGIVSRSAVFFGYFKMNVYHSGAIISGRTAVGGAFGELNGMTINGRLEITLDDGTRIGDYKGSLGDGSDEEADTTDCYCLEAGGVAGVYGISTSQNTNGKIKVTICDDDELSMIFAGGNDYSDLTITADTAGVGGVFGSVKGFNNTNSAKLGSENCTYIYHSKNDVELEAYAYLISESRNVTVYSNTSNVGGFAGYMASGDIRGCFATAVVKGDGEDAGVGGFIGKITKGQIWNSFCGGHTVNGQYIPLYENIVGIKYAGGFVGYVGPDVEKVYQCYSTASVRGNNYVGGFAGYLNSSKGDLINQTYCTGLVFTIGAEDDTQDHYFGSFTGYALNANQNLFKDSKVVEAINKDKLMVGNITGSINSGKLKLAKWNGGADGNHIRINKDSIYHKTAFDSILQPDDVAFPLRTFVSVKVTENSSRWEGIHYGDWPVIPIEDEMHILRNSDIFFDETAVNVFSGTVVEPDVAVKKGTKTLEKDKDYSVVYWRNNKIGTAAVIIVGMGDYYGYVTKNFEITSADIASPEFAVTLKNAQNNPATEFPYNEEGVKPKVEVVYTKNNKSVTLVENRDYTLEFLNNVDPGVGTATVKITGIGNYTGSVDVNFTILPVFTVNFEAGGETVYVPQRIVQNQVVVRPVDPKLTGHIFVDWYKDAELITKYNFADPVTADLTIYAKWTKEQYVVNFVDNGGVPVEAQTVEYNDTIDVSKISEQIKTDCTFVAWCSDEACTEEFDFSTPITGAMTLYALWRDNPLVSYDGVDIAAERIEYGSTVTKPEDPTKEHYTFGGWYKDAGFETTYDFSEPVTGDIVIYAKWISNPTIYLHISDTPDEIEVPYEYNLNDLNLSDPEKDGGYKFVGWYADEQFNEEFDFDKLATEDVHIYAKFILVKTHVVTYVLDDESGEITATVEEGKTFDFIPEKDGFVFDRWFIGLDLNDFSNPFDASIPITKDVQLHASWKEACTVTMVISDDEAPEEKLVGKGDKFTYVPVREGYRFLGWYEDDPNVLIDFSTIVINRDYNIHALWEEET